MEKERARERERHRDRQRWRERGREREERGRRERRERHPASTLTGSKVLHNHVRTLGYSVEHSGIIHKLSILILLIKLYIIVMKRGQLRGNSLLCSLTTTT